MSKIWDYIFILCICIGLLQCNTRSFPTKHKVSRELTATEKRLVESDNKFGLKLFNEIIKEERDKNVFISPLSVAMALGMTYNGANGETQEAMQKTLELNDLTTQEVNESYKSLIELLSQLDPKVRFQIANSIWYCQEFSFEKEFIDLNRTYFNAQVSGLDFNDPNAAKTINGWVDEKTNGKIKEIVDSPIDPFTVMFLINAIYFKGTWTYQFDKSLTKDDWFTLPDGSKKACKMMTQEGEFQYFRNADFQALDLPYGDGDFSMTIFLPHLQKDIDSLIGEFNQKNWDQWINSFSKHEGTLQLPKFTLEYELKLNDILKALGMAVAFDPFEADFTKMYKGPQRLFISEVKHKTFVKVNEEGTEAAAATSVGISYTSVGFWIRVDRPFVFVLRENKSQTILFMGKIVEPTLE
ncbi:MAG: serpin family protein [candidate division Zixibacteria bacterium]|nr:serpin family protein [candidate division Zixibacteria bacterium]